MLHSRISLSVSTHLKGWQDQTIDALPVDTGRKSVVPVFIVCIACSKCKSMIGSSIGEICPAKMVRDGTELRDNGGRGMGLSDCTWCSEPTCTKGKSDTFE